MSRDRLAAMRAGNQGQPPSNSYNNNTFSNSNNNGYGNDDEPSYPPMRQAQPAGLPSGPRAGGGGLPSGPRGGGARRQDSYGGGGGGYQMEERGGGGGAGGGGGRGNQAGGRKAKRGSGYSLDERGEVRNDMEGFFRSISDIQSTLKDLSSSLRTLSSIQQELSTLPSTSPDYPQVQTQQTTLTSTIRTSIQRVKSALTSLTSETKSLARIPGSITQSDVDLRLSQLKAQQSRLLSLVEEFGTIERTGREGEKRKLERQIKIVDPSLDDYAVKQRVEEALRTGNDGVFAQALSSRQNAARGALDEVKRRQEEILQIERTLVELAELFNDLSIRVEQQDEVIIAIEKQTETAAVDMQQGVGEMEKAVKSARGARKKRIWCFVIFLIILIIVGVVVAIKIVSNNKK